MRPRDAAAWLQAGRLDAAFISTDTALETRDRRLADHRLGFSRSDLVVACRTSAPYVRRHGSRREDRRHPSARTGPAEWFAGQGVDVDVVAMGGSLEGICAVGIADAIVDLRETGGSLSRNRLRVLEEIRPCEAEFVTARSANDEAIDLMALRVSAALNARRTQYVMLHVDADRVGELCEVFAGLDSPTVLPLAGRSDRVAAHMVVEKSDLWRRLQDLRDLGATDIVALPTDAIL